MFGTSFDNETTKKYVAAFGTLFNDIQLTRKDNNGNPVQTMTVPLNFAPFQKFLSRIKQDPDLKAPSMSLPRMSFEITGMEYDPTRKLQTSLESTVPYSTNNDKVHSVFSPVPYNYEFQLNIMVKNYEDGTRIVEQIIPYFRPHFTMSMYLIDGYDPLDVSVILNSASLEDTYEGSYEEQRMIVWTLTFTLQGYLYGPTRDKKVIKFVKTNIYDSFEATTPSAIVTVQPGLTANGQPTTDANNSIAYANINFTDSWAYIVKIEDSV